MTLQRLWIDEHGGLTAIKRNGRSMPLYNATEVDEAMEKLLSLMKGLAKATKGKA